MDILCYIPRFVASFIRAFGANMFGNHFSRIFSGESAKIRQIFFVLSSLIQNP